MVHACANDDDDDELVSALNDVLLWQSEQEAELSLPRVSDTLHWRLSKWIIYRCTNAVHPFEIFSCTKYCDLETRVRGIQDIENVAFR